MCISLYLLLDKYYSAKKAYYNSCDRLLTDQEFDSLERSIIAIHGVELFNKYECVGYNEAVHKVVKAKLALIKIKMGRN